ncbi:MAG: hypothetical protein NVSMB47_00330 [Polyangiales bacterium]
MSTSLVRSMVASLVGVGALGGGVGLAGVAGCAAGSVEDASRGSLGVAPLVTCPADLQPWRSGVGYSPGDLARYGASVYRCVQAHTALDTWTPDVVPALWDEVACAGPGTGGGGKSDHDGGCGGSGGGSPAGADAGPPSSSGDAGAPGSSDAAVPPSGGAHASGTEYAPYFYTWGWGNPAYPFTGLVDLQKKSGLSAVTLAFVLSSGGCHASRDIEDHAADAKAFVAAGGHIKASFGGADGTYLENACGDEASMAAALTAFVDETGITDLDFDVEQGGAMSPEVSARRAKALRSVQVARGIKVAFTLPAFPRDKWGALGGMTPAGIVVVTAAIDAGLTISHVNLMTMDYGGYYSTGRTMGELAQSAATDCATQLQSMIPGLGEADAFAMIGATPMIGKNDVSSETFTLDDARSLVAFAKAKHLGLLAFWAINRDQPCASASLGLCSAVNTKSFEFHEIFTGAL